MKPELLAPAGTPEAAFAALAAGADAVYLGMREFSARAEAGNFDEAQLSALLAHARSLSPRRAVHVALNTLVREGECPALARLLETLEELGPDALIVQDPGVARMVRRHFPSLRLHASTQMAVHSAEGVRAMADLGFSRVVLARECTLEEIAAAVEAGAGACEVEAFLHGALCYSCSGFCLYSAMERGRSGNRGRCCYGCREKRDGAFPFSMRDLALAPLLRELVATGVSSLKIEGRMKSPLWVSCVVRWYRGLLDGTLSEEESRRLADDVRSVFAREWTTLYATGEKGPPEGVVDPRSLGHRGAPAGRVLGVSAPDSSGARWMRMSVRLPFERHDGLQMKLPAFLAESDGHPWGFAVGRIRRAGRDVFAAAPGDTVDVALPRSGPVPDIPVGQEVLLATSQDVARRHPLPPAPRTVAGEGRPAVFEIAIAPDGISVAARDAARPSVSASLRLPGAFEPARAAGRTAAAAREAFSKLGGTGWRVADPARDVSVLGGDALFVPASALNAARRAAVGALDEAAARHAAATVEAALSDGAEEPAAWPEAPAPALTRKFGAEAPPRPAEGAGRVVLALRHSLLGDLSALLRRLDAWTAALGFRPALALPLLCRDREAHALDAALDALLGAGFSDWEAADWAGVRRLRARGVRAFTADFTLPVENRDAAAALFSLGAARCVLSPEVPRETAAALAETFPGRIEQPVRQFVPLFVSATPPGAGSGPLRLFGGRPPVVSFLLDGRWITTRRSPWTSPPLPSSPSREDFAWDPPRA